ncbi:MAG: histidine phosphatase family protein [Cyanobacteriota bacterium]|nr:histidine phosphatase family protein [Cyanobacteriota bacterium]
MAAEHAAMAAQPAEPAAGALELWLLRHGATAWARSGRHTGSTDLPLLPEGEAEARQLAPLLARQSFAAVLVSPLLRARRTCELAGLGDRAEPCEALREWNYGAYEGITTAEIRRSIPDWTVFSHGCPGGEDAAQVQRRCDALLEELAQRAPAWLAERTLQASPGGSQHAVMRVALFAHGHILRSLAGCWLGLGVQGGALLSLSTATVSVLGHERERATIVRWNAPMQPLA